MDRSRVIGMVGRKPGAWAVCVAAVTFVTAPGQTPAREYVYVNGRLVAVETPTPAPTVNGAAFVGWVTLPSVVTIGYPFEAQVKFRNTGTRTWLSGSHKVGAQSPQDTTRWGDNRGALIDGPIAPGQEGTFRIQGTPPTPVGTYAFDWRMLQEGVEWFGPTESRQVQVLANSAQTQLVEFAPATSTAVTVTQTVRYNDADGVADIKDIHVRTGTFPDVNNGTCYWIYERSTNLISLYDYSESGSPKGTLAAGTAGMISSNYCELRNPTADGVGTQLTVSAQVTMKGGLAGNRKVWVMGRDIATAGAGLLPWAEVGSWAAIANLPPVVLSVAPATGTGNRQVFSMTYRDPNGYGNLREGLLLVNSVVDGANACFVVCDLNWNTFGLRNDAGTAWQWMGATDEYVSNSRCKLHRQNSGASGSGTDLVVNYDIELLPLFAGPRMLYGHAADLDSLYSGWTEVGSFTILGPPFAIAPETVSVGQAGASGQTIQLTGLGNWTASGAPAWLTVSPASGTIAGTVAGTATITYDVGPNTGAARSGTAVLGSTGNSKVFTVNQAGCASSMVPQMSNVSGGGGEGLITVASNCGSWTATSNVAWAQIRETGPMQASGSIHFTVSANPGAARSGTLTVAGAAYWLYQGAPTSPPTIYMDEPAPGVTATGNVPFAGWAIDSASVVEGAITRVNFSVAANQILTNYGAHRGDVCSVFPGRVGCPYVGWSGVWDTKVVSNGPATVTATAWDSDVPSQSASASRTVTVSNPTPPWGSEVCVTGQFVDPYPNECPKDPIISGTTGTLRLFARGVRNATGVVFPTWSDYNGQDDVVYYAATKVGTDPNYGGDLWMATVNLANHKAGNHYYGRFYSQALMEWMPGGVPAQVLLNSADFRRQSGAMGAGGGAVQNGGLETGSLSPWLGFGGTQQSASTAAAHGGSYSIRQWGADGGMYQDARGLIPGQMYRVKAWVRAESGVANGQLWAHDTFGANNSLTGSLAISAAWQQLSIVYTATNGGALRLHLQKIGSAGVLYWDDITVTGPVAQNPGFESGALTNWGISNNPELFTASTAQKFAGSYAMRIDPGTPALAWADVDGLDAGVTYQIEVWLKGTSALDTGQVTLDDTMGGNVVQSLFLYGADQEWRRVRLNYTANGTGKVRVKLARSSGSGAIYWDELSVTR